MSTRNPLVLCARQKSLVYWSARHSNLSSSDLRNPRCSLQLSYTLHRCRIDVAADLAEVCPQILFITEIILVTSITASGTQASCGNGLNQLHQARLDSCFIQYVLLLVHCARPEKNSLSVPTKVANSTYDCCNPHVCETYSDTKNFSDW